MEVAGVVFDDDDGGGLRIVMKAAAVYGDGDSSDAAGAGLQSPPTHQPYIHLYTVNLSQHPPALSRLAYGLTNDKHWWERRGYFTKLK